MDVIDVVDAVVWTLTDTIDVDRIVNRKANPDDNRSTSQMDDVADVAGPYRPTTTTTTTPATSIFFVAYF